MSGEVRALAGRAAVAFGRAQCGIGTGASGTIQKEGCVGRRTKSRGSGTGLVVCHVGVYVPGQCPMRVWSYASGDRRQDTHRRTTPRHTGLSLDRKTAPDRTTSLFDSGEGKS